MDIPLIEKLVQHIKSRFDSNGQPPHRQPAASQIAFNDHSAIFVVDLKVLKNMEPAVIQEIHRYRHILVTGVDPGRPVLFDIPGLQKLADIDQEVDIQCISIPSPPPSHH